MSLTAIQEDVLEAVVEIADDRTLASIGIVPARVVAKVGEKRGQPVSEKYVRGVLSDLLGQVVEGGPAADSGPPLRMRFSQRAKLYFPTRAGVGHVTRRQEERREREAAQR